MQLVNIKNFDQNSLKALVSNGRQVFANLGANLGLNQTRNEVAKLFGAKNYKSLEAAIEKIQQPDSKPQIWIGTRHVFGNGIDEETTFTETFCGFSEDEVYDEMSINCVDWFAEYLNEDEDLFSNTDTSSVEAFKQSSLYTTLAFNKIKEWYRGYSEEFENTMIKDIIHYIDVFKSGDPASDAKVKAALDKQNENRKYKLYVDVKDEADRQCYLASFLADTLPSVIVVWAFAKMFDDEEVFQVYQGK